jgi:uncharacterized protein YndB with AHSA1/START domain
MRYFSEEGFMATVSDCVFINAPVERVFRRITSPCNWTRFVTGLTKVGRISTDEMQPGTTFEWEGRMFGKACRGTGHVNQVVVNAKFSMSMNGYLPVNETYTFTPVSGGTELKVTVAFELPQEMQRLSPETSESGMEGRDILERIRLVCEEA